MLLSYVKQLNFYPPWFVILKINIVSLIEAGKRFTQRNINKSFG